MPSNDFVFGEPKTFKEIFPQIADVKITVKEIGDFAKVHRTHHITIEDFHDIRCSLCEGGVSLLGIVRCMVRKNKTEYETEKWCDGQLQSSKGRNLYGPCPRTFRVTVHIDYKQNGNIA